MKIRTIFALNCAVYSRNDILKINFGSKTKWQYAYIESTVCILLVKLVIVEDYFIEIRGIYVTELKVRYIHTETLEVGII